MRPGSRTADAEQSLSSGKNKASEEFNDTEMPADDIRGTWGQLVGGGETGCLSIHTQSRHSGHVRNLPSFAPDRLEPMQPPCSPQTFANSQVKLSLWRPSRMGTEPPWRSGRDSHT